MPSIIVIVIFFAYRWQFSIFGRIEKVTKNKFNKMKITKMKNADRDAKSPQTIISPIKIESQNEN